MPALTATWADPDWWEERLPSTSSSPCRRSGARASAMSLVISGPAESGVGSGWREREKIVYVVHRFHHTSAGDTILTHDSASSGAVTPPFGTCCRALSRVRDGCRHATTLDCGVDPRARRPRSTAAPFRGARSASLRQHGTAAHTAALAPRRAPHAVVSARVQSHAPEA